MKITGGNVTKNDCIGWFCPTAKRAFSAATNFAEGYVTGLLAVREVSLMTPCVPTLDGYVWWQKDGDFKVEVLNSSGKVVCLPEDIEEVEE